MALTDLTGTTWTLNDSLTSYAGGTYSLKTYSVNITTETPLPTYNGDADTFVMLTVGYDSGGETNVAQVYTTSPASWDNVAMFATGNDTKTLPDTWVSGKFSGTFTITGGTDATNSVLIAWLEDNCTNMTPPTPDVVVTYEGANIVELSEAGTKTLKTAGKYLTDDVVLAYSGGSGGGGGGAAATVSVEWTLSPMMPGSIGPTFYYVGSDGTYRSYECEEMNSPTPLSVLTPSIIAAESGTWSASGSIDLYKTPNYFYKLAFVYGDGRISAESG